MRLFRRSSVLLLAAALACGLAYAATRQDAVVVGERSESFEISVPVSRLVLRLPKANFVQSASAAPQGGTANPRYFMFMDKTRGMTLSGWFEPSAQFKGVKPPAPAQYMGQNLVYDNVSYGKVADWETVTYDVRIQSIDIANIRAHLVRAGTWIELHLSGRPGESLPEQHTALVETIRSLDVSEKQD